MTRLPLTITSGTILLLPVFKTSLPGLSGVAGCFFVHTTPRHRVQSLLIRRWQETGALSLLHHWQMQNLLSTLRREKQLVAKELIGLMLDDLYEREA